MTSTQDHAAVVIGTRGSELALWQARHLQALLGGEAAGVTLQIIRTRGDKLLDIPLQQQVDKGFFTKELESALLDRSVDVAVHSLKDLPTQMPPGVVLAAVPTRADVGDVLFVHPQAYAAGFALPMRAGAKVGTASLRRKALLDHAAPHAVSTFLRGNVPTRLNKAKTGELDAVILARAGVARLGLALDGLLAFDLDPTLWLPAAAQGALGIQCRDDDRALCERLQAIADPQATRAVAIERELLQRMEGGCHSPFGATAVVAGDQATLRAGTVDATQRWHAVVCAGPWAALAGQAEAELREKLASAPSPPEARPWVTPSRPWS